MAAATRRGDRFIAIIEAAVGLGVVAIVVGRSYDAASTVMFVLCGLAARQVQGRAGAAADLSAVERAFLPEFRSPARVRLLPNCPIAD